ncbi:WXG100 family type VII secretion target [Mycobacteroides abscessus]|uniref:WXG100 family type VII secretion target n=1 Tax=Mycobacteroides abscessus TaxID=36809 RepID=UPI002107BDC5|nr:WXG100 family type VII secretion target [Mycobacteroides abscessus]
MSAPLNVDPAQLHAVSGLAADAARDLQRELDQLEHRWEDLSSTWDGVASRAFGPEFDAWREGAQKTVAALDSASVTRRRVEFRVTQRRGSGSTHTLDSELGAADEFARVTLPRRGRRPRAGIDRCRAVQPSKRFACRY